jgi:hypothetical protein
VNKLTPKYTPILPTLLLVTPSHAQGCSLQEILSKLEVSLEEFESLPASVVDAETMSEAEWRAYNELHRRRRSQYAAAAACARSLRCFCQDRPSFSTIPNQRIGRMKTSYWELFDF